MATNSEPREDKATTRKQRLALSNDFMHGLTPEQFHKEAEALGAMTAAARARLKAQLIERLKTPVDRPTWGPDWVRHGERVAAQNGKKKGAFAKLLDFSGRKKDDEEDDASQGPLSEDEADDAAIISRNMEKSRPEEKERADQDEGEQKAVAVFP